MEQYPRTLDLIFEEFRKAVWISYFLQFVHQRHDRELARNWQLVRKFVSRHPGFELDFGRKLIYRPRDSPHLVGKKVSHVISHRDKETESLEKEESLIFHNWKSSDMRKLLIDFVTFSLAL